MFSFCSKGSPACLWSEMDQFCRVLQKGSVPIDKKWPLLILQLRDVADHPFLDDAQKARMHEILVELLQKKVFSDERYLQTVDSIHSVMQAPYEAKMLEISRETYNLLEDINRLNVFPVPDGDTGTNMSLTINTVITQLSPAEAYFTE